ncbi:putative methyl-accepting chemotaxis protein [Marinomonas sp. MED121]|uniref:methyl-accepting chemotaxis protein n=1 Tax=Marinomonas sp. MED121 TaxID=314277 RepID=UPI0000691269|nr:methyl-accepting chemotaxis protein [Marinomonas sp. MED121]EAQ63556.1 putative methyl-accepting chemotaxis protein [Marinomonas sp. MED121]
MGLSKKIVIVNAILLFLVSISISFYGVFTFYNTEVDNTAYSMRENVSSGREIIDLWLDNKLAAINAGATVYPLMSKLDAFKISAKQTGQGAGFDNVFFSLKNNVIYSLKGGERAWAPGSPWMEKATVQGYISEPIYGTTLKKMVIQLSQKAKTADGNDAVLGAAIGLEDINSIVSENKPIGEGLKFIVSKSGVIISHANLGLTNKVISDVYPALSMSMVSALADEKKLDEVLIDSLEYVVTADRISKTGWFIVAIENKGLLFSTINSLIIKTVVISILLIIISILLLACLVNYLLSGLLRVNDALVDIAKGEGDLTVRIDILSKDEVGQLASNFNHFVAKIQEVIINVHDVSLEVAKKAQISKLSSELTSKDLTSQQDEITMVATAITQMSTATDEIASNAEITAKDAESAVGLSTSTRIISESSQQSMTLLISKIAEAKNVIGVLNSKNEEINSIVSVIQGIAEQTNLLALNAAIEAARAGEMGRGFAVVADEVRVLSQRTHASTEEITKTLADLQGISHMAVEAMIGCDKSVSSAELETKKVTKAFLDIDTSIKRISDMAVHIATAAEEQTAVTSEINSNSESISEISLSLQQKSISAAEDAIHLDRLAIVLTEKVREFKLHE